MSPLLALGIGFIIGVPVGMSWRGAFEILTGKVDPMPGIKKILSNQVLLTWMLILSMLLTAGVGVGIVIADHHDRKADECRIAFNQKSADAREARTGVTSQDVAPAELVYVQADKAYQEGLKKLTNGQPGEFTAEDLNKVLDDKIDAADVYATALAKQIQVVKDNPYPPADYCERSNDDS